MKTENPIHYRQAFEVDNKILSKAKEKALQLGESIKLSTMVRNALKKWETGNLEISLNFDCVELNPDSMTSIFVKNSDRDRLNRYKDYVHSRIRTSTPTILMNILLYNYSKL